MDNHLFISRLDSILQITKQLLSLRKVIKPGTQGLISFLQQIAEASGHCLDGAAKGGGPLIEHINLVLNLMVIGLHTAEIANKVKARHQNDDEPNN